jgi:homoserine dehydrogenase
VSDAFVREMAAFDDEKTKLMAKNLKSQQKKFSQVRSVVSLCSKCTRSMTFENLQQAEAEKEGMVLRYVGSVDLANKKCEVKLAKYPKTHPFAGTQYASSSSYDMHVSSSSYDIIPSRAHSMPTT